MKRTLVIGIMFFFVLALVNWIGNKEPSSPNWQVVGRLDNDDMFRFVVITPGLEKKREVYDDAVAVLCMKPSSPPICVLDFFAKGDRIPPDQSRKEFFEAGGLKDYPVLAGYWGNRHSKSYEFGAWDCERAGIQGAPLTSLCGPGIKETYEAVLSLGGYANMVATCGWPQTNDEAHFKSFLSTVSDQARREQYSKGFSTMMTGRGPDNPEDCVRLRTKIENRAREARQTLGIPQP